MDEQTELIGRSDDLIEQRAAEETEWTGLPAFHAAPPRDLRLVLSFETPEARDEAVAKLGVVIAKKTGPTWSAWYPPREREDLASLRFDFDADEQGEDEAANELYDNSLSVGDDALDEILGGDEPGMEDE